MLAGGCGIVEGVAPDGVWGDGEDGECKIGFGTVPSLQLTTNEVSTITITTDARISCLMHELAPSQSSESTYLSIDRSIGRAEPWAASMPQQPRSTDTTSMRILLVEDEPLQQEALGIALTACGHTVTPAGTFSEALALLDDPFDAVILDVRIPDPSGWNRDGLTLLGEFRARQSSVPVAVFTGVPLSEAEEMFAAYQNATVIYKPQTLDRILEFLALHLTQA